MEMLIVKIVNLYSRLKANNQRMYFKMQKIFVKFVIITLVLVKHKVNKNNANNVKKKY